MESLGLGVCLSGRIWQRKTHSHTLQSQDLGGCLLPRHKAPSPNMHIWCPAAFTSESETRPFSCLPTFIPSPPHRSLMGAICSEFTCTVFIMENSSHVTCNRYLDVNFVKFLWTQSKAIWQSYVSPRLSSKTITLYWGRLPLHCRVWRLCKYSHKHVIPSHLFRLLYHFQRQNLTLYISKYIPTCPHTERYTQVVCHSFAEVIHFQNRCFPMCWSMPFALACTVSYMAL